MIKKIKIYLKTILGFYKTYVYSQEGEELILSKIFLDESCGFYIDIGAHHPKRFSNTFHFYKKGWKGINVDAMPGSMKLFKTFRSRDINLELAVSDKKEILNYYAFDEPALNGFDSSLSQNRASNDHKIIFQKQIETHTLKEILDTYLPTGQEISFLTVDVEGLDLQVLKSNNWEKYRPRVVLCEGLTFTFEEMNNSDLIKFMSSKNYRIFAKTYNTCFFIDKNNGNNAV